MGDDIDMAQIGRRRGFDGILQSLGAVFGCGDGQSNGTGTAEDSCLIHLGPAFNGCPTADEGCTMVQATAAVVLAGFFCLRLLLKLTIMVIPFFIN